MNHFDFCGDESFVTPDHGKNRRFELLGSGSSPRGNNAGNIRSNCIGKPLKHIQAEYATQLGYGLACNVDHPAGSIAITPKSFG
jgi:hypothetical protein